MDLPTIHLQETDFKALRVLPTGEYNQNPPGRFKSSTGQWLYIAPSQCEVIEVVPDIGTLEWELANARTNR